VNLEAGCWNGLREVLAPRAAWASARVVRRAGLV
jgi:hypothetical protein